jgi:hypothetical protein
VNKLEQFMSTAKPTARKRQMETAFSRVPLKEAAAIAKKTRNLTLFIWQWLLYEAWRAGNATISVSNGPLGLYEIDRHAKYRALKALAKLGAITIHRSGKQAIRVTIHEKFL